MRQQRGSVGPVRDSVIREVFLRAVLALLVGCQSPIDLPPAEGSDCFVELARGEGVDEYVYDVAWSPDGAIVTGGADHLRWYDEGLVELASVENTARFNSVVFDGQGRLYAPTGGELRRYAEGLVADGALTIGEAELQRADVTDDGTRVLICDTEGLVHLVDAVAMTVLDSLPVHQRCTRVALSADGGWGLSAGHDGDVVLTELTGDRIRVADRLPLGGESGEARFFADGLAYAGSFDEPFDLVQLSVAEGTLTVVDTLSDHRSGVGAIDRHPTRPVLVTGDHDHTVHLYDVAGDGHLTARHLLPDDGLGVHDARFGPEDRLARTASRQDTVVLYDTSACFE